MKTPEFYLHAVGPTGLFFNFSDCGTRGGIAPALHWFAQRRNDPHLLWRERMELEDFAKQKPSSSGSGDRMLAFLLIWAGPIGEVPIPEQLHWHGDGHTPVAMFRGAWDKNATYAGIKGGSPSTNHAHMDTGSFVLDMEGVRWGLDLGSQGYHSLESKGIGLWSKNQESERWTVFRLNNFSHNTLVVDGQLQQVKGHAPIIAFSDDPVNPHTVIDLSPVYEEQLAEAKRGLRLLGKSVLIQDEVLTLENNASVRWGMVTSAEVTLSNNARAVLEKDERTVALRVLSPEGAKLEIYETENPPRDYDSKNPGTRMIGFTTKVDADSRETLVVHIQPGEPSEEDTPPIVPLEKWQD
jgi:hypothetical protein